MTVENQVILFTFKIQIDMAVENYLPLDMATENCSFIFKI